MMLLQRYLNILKAIYEGKIQKKLNEPISKYFGHLIFPCELFVVANLINRLPSVNAFFFRACGYSITAKYGTHTTKNR